MTIETSIPPLRELPAGRLVEREQHLLTEIGREPEPRLPMSRFGAPRRRLAALAGAGAAAALAAIAAAIIFFTGTAPAPRNAFAPQDAFAAVLSRGSRPTTDIAAFERLGLIADSVRLVGTFQKGDAVFARVYAARAPGNKECYATELHSGTTPDGRPLTSFGVGCSPSILHPRNMGIAWEARGGANGKPALVLGLVAPGASVQVIDTAGVVHAPERDGDAFLYRSTSTENAPAAVVVRSSGGAVHRYPLGH